MEWTGTGRDGSKSNFDYSTFQLCSMVENVLAIYSVFAAKTFFSPLFKNDDWKWRMSPWKPSIFFWKRFMESNYTNYKLLCLVGTHQTSPSKVKDIFSLLSVPIPVAVLEVFLGWSFDHPPFWHRSIPSFKSSEDFDKIDVILILRNFKVWDRTTQRKFLELPLPNPYSVCASSL